MESDRRRTQARPGPGSAARCGRRLPGAQRKSLSLIRASLRATRPASGNAATNAASSRSEQPLLLEEWSSMARVAALSLLLLVSGALRVGAQDFYSGTDVVELTAANFKSKVLEDEHIWMVEFYAPWCGHCQRLKPDYIKAATASKGIVRFGAINCDDHRSIASEYGIKGFPTLKLFGTNKKRPEDYNGARSPKGMADAAIALLPNHVTVVGAKGHEAWLEKSAEVPKALLFTAKGSTTALYKALALDLKGRMALGEVRAKKETELAAKYGVEEAQLPVLLVLPLEGVGEAVADGEKQVKYDGELKHKPLLKFLVKYAKPKPGKASTSSSKSSSASPKAPEPSKPAPAQAGPAVAQLRNAADVEARCIKAKGFCVLALLPAGEDDAAVKQHVERLEALEQRYHKDPLKFSWVDVSKAPAAEALFVTEAAKAEGTPPAVVLLSPKRGKFTVHWGFDGLESLLDRAIGGDVTLESKVEEGWRTVLDSA